MRSEIDTLLCSNNRISNVEYRFLNIEVRYSTILYLLKEKSPAMPTFDIRYSLIDIQNSIFILTIIGIILFRGLKKNIASFDLKK